MNRGGKSQPTRLRPLLVLGLSFWAFVANKNLSIFLLVFFVPFLSASLLFSSSVPDAGRRTFAACCFSLLSLLSCLLFFPIWHGPPSIISARKSALVKALISLPMVIIPLYASVSHVLQSPELTTCFFYAEQCANQGNYREVSSIMNTSPRLQLIVSHRKAYKNSAGHWFYPSSSDSAASLELKVGFSRWCTCS